MRLLMWIPSELVNRLRNLLYASSGMSQTPQEFQDAVNEWGEPGRTPM